MTFLLSKLKLVQLIKVTVYPNKLECFIMAEFILEDRKLVTDRIPSEKIPTDKNLRMVNRLRVVTYPCLFNP